jgi:hypothetical protein
MLLQSSLAVFKIQIAIGVLFLATLYNFWNKNDAGRK